MMTNFFRYGATPWILTLCLCVAPLSAFSGTVLVLGDSISAAYGIPREAGWVNLLKERLDENFPDKYQVINASISGDTTAGGLQRLPALLDQHKPSKVVVGLGGNDGLRGMSLKQMESNLTNIITLSKEQGAEVVLLGIELPPSYGAMFNRRFQKVYRDVEKALDVPMVPLGFGLLNDRNLLQADGIHPTEEAQPIILDQVWPLIASGEEGSRRKGFFW